MTSPHNLAYRFVGENLIEVDVNQSHYFGLNWKHLGAWAKRKFENLIVLSNSNKRVKLLFMDNGYYLGHN